MLDFSKLSPHNFIVSKTLSEWLWRTSKIWPEVILMKHFRSLEMMLRNTIRTFEWQYFHRTGWLDVGCFDI